MRRLFRIAFLVCLLSLLTLCVWANEADREPVAPSFTAPAFVPESFSEFLERQESFWERRIPDADLSVHYILVDCGKKKVDIEATGYLDLSYRFKHSYWAGTGSVGSVSGRQDSAWDYYGDNATMRVRCFAYRNEYGEAKFCRLSNWYDADGRALGGGIDDNVNLIQRYTFSFQSFAPPEGSAPEPTAQGETLAVWSHRSGSPFGADAAFPDTEASLPDAPDRNETRSFAWLSSDERVLWSVELCGAFHGSECVEASGSVEVCDENWRCEDAAFFVRDGCAVAMVTLRRYTLGVPVAERSFEFRLPPPARAYPSG